MEEQPFRGSRIARAVESALPWFPRLHLRAKRPNSRWATGPRSREDAMVSTTYFERTAMLLRLCVAVALLAIAARSASADDRKLLKVGMSGALTGPAAALGL